MNVVLTNAESILQDEAEKYCPEGTAIKAVVHQWLHAIAHNATLFGENSGVNKAELIDILKKHKMYKNRKEFKATIYSGLKLLPVDQPKFKFIDLFAGIGGVRLGFQDNNGLCVFSSEFNKYAQETYFNNHGEYPFGDITKIAPDSIPEHDVLLAGFPCQPFSIAGVSKNNALGRAHGFMNKAQGTLFFDVLRILKYHKPAAFLLENVFFIC